MSEWLCYIVRSENRTYVGITNNLPRRLRQHNGEIKGGAKATRGRAWTLVCTVHGFPTVTALKQFEWRMHHPPIKGSGLAKRLQNLEAVLKMPRWTRTAPLTSSCELRVVWHDLVETNHPSFIESRNEHHATVAKGPEELDAQQRNAGNGQTTVQLDAIVSNLVRARSKPSNVE